MTGTISCSSSSGGGSTTSGESGLLLPSNTVKSTPQIYGSLLVSNLALGQSKAVGDSSSNQSLIESFFKLECHNDNGSLNFCPSGVDSTSLNTKFSTTTLIGLLQHADMYLSNIYTVENIVDPETGESVETPTYKTCEKGSPSYTLTNHTPVYTPTDANTFVLDFGSLFDCVGDFVFVSNTSYALYSKAEDNLHFAGLTSRKQDTGSVNGTNYTMSDIFQSYVRRSETGSPVILGFNLASYSDWSATGGDSSGERAILITNISNHRFIVKFIMGLPEDPQYTDGYAYIVAIGTAGYDPSNSSWVSGYYLVETKFHDDGAAMTCVQNGATPAMVQGPTSIATWTAPAADQPCGDVAGLFSAEGWTFAALLEWLGATADATNLASFESFFNNADFLSSAATVVPHDVTTYYPTSISN